MNQYTLPNGFPASPLQNAIIDYAINGDASMRIDGVAGCAKTTTSEAMFKFRAEAGYPGGQYLCFNKAIQREAQPMMEQYGARANTFHSFGMQALRKVIPKFDVDGNKPYAVERWAMQNADLTFDRDMDLCIPQALSYCRNTAFTPNSDPFDMEQAMQAFGLPCDQDAYSVLASLMPELMRYSIYLAREQGIIDFDDMLWLPVVLNAPFNRHDWIVVDEAQDTAPIQQEILVRSVTAQGRICIVGDPHQAIYGFRGADSAAMRNLADRFQAKHFPLSITYRVPKSGVQLAQEIVPHMENGPNAKDGTVNNLDDEWSVHDLKQGDLLLCRMNRPLLMVANLCLQEQVPFELKDDRLHKSLLKIIRGVCGNVKKDEAAAQVPINWFLQRLPAWRDQEIEKMKRKKTNPGSLRDNCASLEMLCDTFEPHDPMAHVQLLLKKLFTPGRGVKLLTIHRSKGLEAQRVWCLNFDQIPWPFAEQPWELDQEKNLYYVGITRFLDTMNFITIDTGF